MASRAPRLRSSNVSRVWRSASVARPVGDVAPKPPAMEPSAPTGMPSDSKNALPRLLVVDGPLKPSEM